MTDFIPLVIKRFMIIFIMLCFATIDGRASEESTQDDSDLSEPFKVAVILPSESRDHSWSQAMYQSMQQVKKNSPLSSLKITIADKVYNDNSAKILMKRYAEENYQLIIAHAEYFSDEGLTVAQEYPASSFALFSKAPPPPTLSNVYTYYVAADQAGYVNGVISALMVDVLKAGLVAPDESFSSYIKDYITGYRNGLIHTSPATNTVIDYVDSTWNISKGSKAASLLILHDLQVMSGVAPQAIGALHIAEKADIFWLGTAIDQSTVAPNVVIASQVYDWTKIFQGIIKKVQGNHKGGEHLVLSYNDGGIKTVYGNSLKVTDEAKVAIQQVINSLSAGHLDPLASDYFTPPPLSY
ncbi:MAG: BMP family ABC transporter substrate-binding protein [Chlamydiota bacterium]